MSECTHDCSTCSANCGSKNKEPESLLEPQNKLSNIKHVIGVVSGKGGVGKSLVTSALAVAMQRKDYKTAVLDADITGPSIPKMFGLPTNSVEGSEDGMFPVKTKTGIETMSVNLLVNDATVPVVWRGPVIAGMVKQFWTDVIWNDVDYMFVDMPPGTGDVALTVFQSLPIEGIVIVTSPQDLVTMIVDKAVNMAKMMNIPVLGFVENYSYIKCPHCDEKISVFGESKIDKIAEERGLKVLDKLPIDPTVAALCDKGSVELISNDFLANAAEEIEKQFTK
ncbi:MAG: Mrp/NBP35 family ATP-binding protein [Clostridia bacterium]|nr:Mrp/NBP35 family ATP-binding protein [Clostridia bacterium]